MKTLLLTTLLGAAAIAAPALAELTPAPEGAMVYIISPDGGSTVSNPVTIRFGLEGMGIAPAGYDVDNTGHHHLLINIEPSEIDMTTNLPATDSIVHFGGGQTEVTTELPAGTHTMQLLLGDYAHIPHDPPILSEQITVTVE
jgi:hypothetical protein